MLLCYGTRGLVSWPSLRDYLTGNLKKLGVFFLIEPNTKTATVLFFFFFAYKQCAKKGYGHYRRQAKMD